MFTERKTIGIGPAEVKAGPRVVALRVTFFLVLFVCLDWISYWHPYAAFDITPWNPPPGVALFLLLRYGLGYLPVYWLAGFTSGLVIPTAPEPILAGLVAHGLVAVAYGGAALVLRAHLSEFRRPQEVFLLIGVSGVAALAAGTGALSVFCLAGYLSWPELPQVVVRFWIGDVIGIAVVTPFLMVRHRWGWPVLETQIQMAAVLLTVVAIFLIQPRETYKMFYLLFLPLLWVAVRGGFEAATRGVVLAQVALLVMLTISGKETSAVISYQFLMLALTATTLVVGAAISSFHAAEAALRASRAHLQAIVTTAPDGVLTVSAEGIVLSANPAMERLTGRVPSAILGLPLTALMAGASLPPVHGEVAVRRSDGTLMPAELAVGQAELAGTAGYIVVVRDMARRKEAEARLREHEAELAHLSRLSAAGAMASALAHEINQPLAAVKTYVRACQRLMRAPACDQARVMETMDKAARQADRAGEIIRRLREFLRKGDTRSEGVDLGSLLREAVALVELAAGRGQVQVSAEVPPGLPPMTVDGIQIQQVLVNLIHNSIEAMNVAGSERREVMLVVRPTDGGIEVGLADSGPGVAPEMAERLFSPFTTSKVDGLGLGLSISRGIVEAHGGRLWYDDSHGPGARFVFWLPASEGLHHAG